MTTITEARTQYNIVPCFACGGTYTYKGSSDELNGRFCSLRCQAWFDDGGQPYGSPDEVSLIGWRVVAGDNVGADYYATLFGRPPIVMKRTTNGFKIDCAGCQKEFESLGLRYCSEACGRRHRERQDNIALMAQAGMEPAVKRRCAGPGCEKTIPKWRNGRAVSKATRFCSPGCQKRAKNADRADAMPAKETNKMGGFLIVSALNWMFWLPELLASRLDGKSPTIRDLISGNGEFHHLIDGDDGIPAFLRRGAAA